MTHAQNAFDRVRILAHQTAGRSDCHVRIMDAETWALGRAIAEMDDVGQWPAPDMSTVDLVVHELVAGAVNYCYWYGRGDIRPGGASSSQMYDLLAEACAAYSDWSPRIRHFAMTLRTRGYPLADRRTDHLLELLTPTDAADAPARIEVFAQGLLATTPEQAVTRIVRAYPGYASDPFLKRAFLAVLQIHRMTGWGEETIGNVPVPADYQVPKILRHFGVIEYGEGLAGAVDEQRPIPEGSVMEVDIRAATIVACDRLATISGRTPGDIDTYLWQNRKATDAPFHLTLTTAY